jgi:L-fuculose-phosphate aldolase
MSDLIAVVRKQKARSELLSGARQLPRRRLVVGTTGSASIRDGAVIHITPSRVPYEAMHRRDLVTVGLDGAPLRGRRAPSRELPMHLAIHAARPDVRAIVHTHTPYAISWSMLADTLAPGTEEAEYFGIGPVGVVPHQPAGSRGLAGSVAGRLGNGKAVLLARHGAVAVGEDLASAIAVAEAVEHMAQVALLLCDREVPS